MDDQYQDLLHRAHWGKLSKRELDRIVAELRRPRPSTDRYTLLQIIGESRDKRYRELVEDYLHNSDDVMLAKLALQTLCVTWGETGRYCDVVLQFLRGVDWDVLRGGHVILIAISIAGEYLRNARNSELLEELIDIYEKEDSVFHDAAFVALGRSLGYTWPKLLMKMVTAEKVLSEAHTRLLKDASDAH
jgi:hypothetical protein